MLSDGEGVATVAGLVALVISLTLPERARRRYVQDVTVPASWSAPRAYLITDDGLTSSTGLTSSRWSWRAVRRVDERPEAYLFWQDAGPVFDLPRAPLSSAQDAELRSHLAGYGLLPRAHEQADKADSPAIRRST